MPELSNSILLFSSPSPPLFFLQGRGEEIVFFVFSGKGIVFLLLLPPPFFGGKGEEEKKRSEEGGKVSQEVFAKTSGNRPRGEGGEKIRRV